MSSLFSPLPSSFCASLQLYINGYKSVNFFGRKVFIALCFNIDAVGNILFSAGTMRYWKDDCSELLFQILEETLGAAVHLNAQLNGYGNLLLCAY